MKQIIIRELTKLTFTDKKNMELIRSTSKIKETKTNEKKPT